MTNLPTQELRSYFAGVYVMKKLDLRPEDGGVKLSVSLPADWYPLEGLLEQLVMEGLIALHRRSAQYQLTAQGIDRVGRLIDEAEGYIEEFDDLSVAEIQGILAQRGIDPLRVRFLWGWYDGEFDDLVEFQRIRGLDPVNPEWAEFLLSEDFYRNLLQDFQASTRALNE